MRSLAQTSDHSRFLPLLIATLVFAAISNVASAQERPPGQLDLQCASDCSATGHDGEYCNQVCWVAEPPRRPIDEFVDGYCLAACRERGGTHSQCRPLCTRR